MKNTLKTIMGAALVTSMVMSCPVAAKAKKGKIKSVKVSNLPAKTLTLKKGKSKTLKFKVTKSGKISKALAYKSSNKKIITVSKKGKVTAKKKGKAKVTAYAKANKKKKVVITVTVGTPVTKVKLNKKKATLYVKKTLKLKATVTPKKASNKKVVWKTSNKKIATVSSKGKVTAKKKGKVTITATAADGSGKKATAKITVKKKATVYNVASMNVTDPYDVTFALNKAQALDKSQVTLQQKDSESANYRDTLKIKSLTTTDNIHYNARLKFDDAIPNDKSDHNVKIAVTGLKNNKGVSVLETIFTKGKINKTYTQNRLVKRGTRITNLDASHFSADGWTYEVAGVPAGMQQDTNKDGVVLYGTPTNTADQDVTVKETDPYGNVYTTTTHLKFYDNDTVNAYANDQYVTYSTSDINTHDTPSIADDTLDLEKTVSAQINYDGGQTYSNGHWVQDTSDQYDTDDEYKGGHTEGYEAVHFTTDNAAFTVDSDGTVSGKVTASTTVNVTVTRKNRAGADTSVVVPVHFYVETPKLVKGQVIAANGKGVADAGVSFVDNDKNSNFTDYNAEYDYYTGIDVKNEYLYANDSDYWDGYGYYTPNYEAVVRADTTYDVLVSQSQSDTYYANQTPADTMNFNIEGNLITVGHNSADVVASGYYDNATNEYYTVVRDGKDQYEILTDGADRTLVNDDDYGTYTLTLAGGAATATLVKK